MAELKDLNFKVNVTNIRDIKKATKAVKELAEAFSRCAGEATKARLARWKVYDGDLCPSCTHCGMGAPYARYKRGNGLNGREITDYCPSCGSKMLGMDECNLCKYHDENGNWQDNGICFACREDTWLPNKKQNERILRE